MGPVPASRRGNGVLIDPELPDYPLFFRIETQ
jgi:hypothetical protein